MAKLCTLIRIHLSINRDPRASNQGWFDSGGIYHGDTEGRGMWDSQDTELLKVGGAAVIHVFLTFLSPVRISYMNLVTISLPTSHLPPRASPPLPHMSLISDSSASC